MPRRKIPHFRLYLQDFRDGTGHMSAAEVGDYIRILIEIYDHDGPLVMDAERLRWALNCRPTMVEKKITRLVELGKLSVDENGFLHNGRADEEIEIRRNWREKYPKNTEKVSEKSAKTSTKSNGTVHSRARHDPVPVYKDSSLRSESSAELKKTAPRQPPLSPQVIGLPTNAGDDYPITTAEVAEWCETYPAVDVGQQLRHMRQWLISNPKNRKTRAGMRKFVTTWLGREQNRAPLFNGTQRATGPPRQDPDREWREIVERKARGE